MFVQVNSQVNLAGPHDGSYIIGAKYENEYVRLFISGRALAFRADQ